MSGCDSVDSSPSTPDGLTVDGSASEARTPTGQYIYWREHLIDSPDVNGGVDITGADGLALMDLDGDSREDIVSVHEDSGHVRVAFASADPNRWELMTLAHRDVDGAEDVVIEDLNGDTTPTSSSRASAVAGTGAQRHHDAKLRTRARRRERCRSLARMS